jgi:hypothetical protein
LPVYLFALCVNNNLEIDCFYKRYTPIITKDIRKINPNSYSGFFKVNVRNTFIAFKYPNEKKLGFVRDLYIDQVRLNYAKGNISFINPLKLGLKQFPIRDAVFGDLFSEYATQLCLTYKKYKPFFEAVINKRNPY